MHVNFKYYIKWGMMSTAVVCVVIIKKKWPDDVQLKHQNKEKKIILAPHTWYVKIIFFNENN